MSSRSDYYKQKRSQRQRRIKRLLMLNGMLAALVLVLGVLLLDSYYGIWSAPAQEGTHAEAAGSGGDGVSAAQDDGQSTEPAAPLAGEQGAGQQTDSSAADGDTAAMPGETGGADEPLQPQDEALLGDGGTGEKVLLSFVGDILLAGSVQRELERNGYDYPYAKVLSYLADADLTAGNLESPFTLRGTPALDKTYVFNGKPEALPALREAGFDVVTLANNHTLDMGVEGLLDTMQHLDEAGLPHVGAGNNDTEAFEPVILETKGIKVAYLGLSRVVPVVEWKAEKYRAGVAETYDTTRAVKAIAAAKEQADLVVVLVHWGKEREEQPEDYQRSYAREYIDAGADLVIGSHPHVLQGFEHYKGKWIAYSLGNFIFNMTTNEANAETGVLDARCTREGQCDLRFHPMKAVASQPARLAGEEAQQLLSRVQALSFGISIDEEGNLSNNM